MALEDGRILLVFGLSDRAEIYDPATDEFSLTDVTYQQGVGGAAVRLNDGRVFLVESNSSVGRVFDPKNGTITPTSPMPFMTGQPEAVLLENGEVLLVALEVALTYDPVDDVFEAIGNPTGFRSGHTVTRLADGRVIFIGGGSSEEPYEMRARAEICDPTTRTFTASGALNIPGCRHDAVLLADGRVVVLGGTTGGLNTSLDQVEVYDPATGRFTLLEERLVYPRLFPTAVALQDGRILVIGHYPRNMPAVPFPDAVDVAELYQP